jgi:hypothetical protein
MKNLFVQKEFGYCTVYMLANLFRDKSFIRFVGNEDFKGCDDKKESELLDLCGYGEMAISDVLYVNHAYRTPLPKDIVLDILLHSGDSTRPAEDVDIPIIPYILSVRLQDTHAFHHATAVINYRGRLLYIDPYKENIVECSNADDLFKNFIDCYAIRRPYIKSNESWAILKGEMLGYDFLKNRELEVK